MLHVVSSDYPLPTINVQSYGEDGLYDTCAKLVTCVVALLVDDNVFSSSKYLSIKFVIPSKGYLSTVCILLSTTKVYRKKMT